MILRLFTFVVAIGILAALVIPSAVADDHSGHFRHVVCFKFKDGTSNAEVEAIAKSFAELEDKIDTIVDFEWGTSDNIEPLNDGFTHCFIVTFENKKGLEIYLPHEAHMEFVALLKPKLDKVFVFDYTVK